jgi:hypothetical protein
MEKAILLAVAASFCTATASVCQRLGARRYEMAALMSGSSSAWPASRSGCWAWRA